MRLGVQASRGVGDQHIDAARTRRLQRIEDDRGRFRARLLRDDRHAVALGPGLELLTRRGAKGIAGREHDAAALGQQPMRQLADAWWSCRRR